MTARQQPLLSVIVPCFNERPTIGEVIERVLALPMTKEIVVVDDGSTDGSSDVLDAIARRHASVRVLHHDTNRGKGAAIATAVREVRGEIVVIQDADLEYEPREFERLLAPIVDGYADVVYGSRFEGHPRRVMLYWHTVGNRLLTWLSNLTTNLNLTDLMTGYKAFRRDIIQSIQLRSKRFGFEAEITAKIARRGYRLYEVPISYRGRDYWEGKKIRWSDGIRAIGTIVKYGLFVRGDSEAGGYITLERMGNLSRYNDWIWRAIEPHVGNRVLEVGAGIGNMTRVMYGRDLIVATDVELPYLHMLRNSFAHNPTIRVEHLDLNSDDHLRLMQYGFDTVVCLNVLEHIEDDEGALQRLYEVLLPGGKLLLFVPADQALYGTMDRQVGHFRRYSREQLAQLIEAAGFTNEQVVYQNVYGRFGWWLNGIVLKRRHMPGNQSRLFDLAVPFLRRIEPRNPSKGLSLVAVAQKPAANPMKSAADV